MATFPDAGPGWRCVARAIRHGQASFVQLSVITNEKCTNLALATFPGAGAGGRAVPIYVANSPQVASSHVE